MTITSLHTPNLRWNAFRLGIGLLWLGALRMGIGLIWLAANPWSGLTRQAARTMPWQPEHPFGWPRWWPFFPAGKGKLVSLDHLRLMRSALGLESFEHCDQPPKKEKAA